MVMDVFWRSELGKDATSDEKKNHGYSTSISMPTTRALIRAGIDSDVDQHRGHVCSKAATTRGLV